MDFAKRKYSNVWSENFAEKEDKVDKTRKKTSRRSRETDEDLRNSLNIMKNGKRTRKEMRGSTREEQRKEKGIHYKSDRERKRNGRANDCRIAPSPTRFRFYRFRDSPCVLYRIVIG